ncbi:MAG: hypothetical protein WGN25_02115 [Candidatus Electrothrix sp. GW3-4]|uniref:hypothetical protein n=1 Tax=Candidatus Electrothrix sp. GW3-4 TaxID=3126740 RepID=UPI0030D194C1
MRRNVAARYEEEQDDKAVLVCRLCWYVLTYVMAVWRMASKGGGKPVYTISEMNYNQIKMATNQLEEEISYEEVRFSISPFLVLRGKTGEPIDH